MYIPAWLIPFVAVLLWACYYYRYGYLELKRKAGKSEREAKQEDNFLVGTPIEPKHANPKLKRWGWRISDSLGAGRPLAWPGRPLWGLVTWVRTWVAAAGLDADRSELAAALAFPASSMAETILQRSGAPGVLPRATRPRHGVGPPCAAATSGSSSDNKSNRSDHSGSATTERSANNGA